MKCKKLRGNLQSLTEQVQENGNYLQNHNIPQDTISTKLIKAPEMKKGFPWFLGKTRPDARQEPRLQLTEYSLCVVL